MFLVIEVSVVGGDLSLLVLKFHLAKLVLLELYRLHGRIICEHLRLRVLQPLGFRQIQRGPK